MLRLHARYQGWGRREDTKAFRKGRTSPISGSDGSTRRAQPRCEWTSTDDSRPRNVVDALKEECRRPPSMGKIREEFNSQQLAPRNSALIRLHCKELDIEFGRVRQSAEDCQVNVQGSTSRLIKLVCEGFAGQSGRIVIYIYHGVYSWKNKRCRLDYRQGSTVDMACL
jgi:hypothetical protein